MFSIPNDEPVYEDDLEHFSLVRHVGDMVRHCHPPYVLGICGAWGSGKTSFLRKLWAYLGCPIDVPDAGGQVWLQREKRRAWFGAKYQEPSQRQDGYAWHVIWFNPWQHQFEQTPSIALLHEIQQYFSLTRRAFNRTGKLMDE